MKKVLMFCVRFFGLENRIANALRGEGHQVDLYDERPNNGFVAKACIRYNVKAYRPAVRRHIRRVIEANRGKDYDCILVVKGEAITPDCLQMLREAFPKAETVLYLWDSAANIPECDQRMKAYDRVLTFDPRDAETYGIPLLLIPYDPAGFAYRDGGEGTYTYDAAFVGTAHSIRPRVIRQLTAACDAAGRRCFSYFYSPHPLVDLFNRVTQPGYRCLPRKQVHFTPMTAEQVFQVYRASRCVLDIEHPRQDGATTRPVEMLPMGKKIITTNRHVKEFPFYNENNFCIIDREEPKVPDAFFDTPYLPVDEAIMARYSPSGFAKKLLPPQQ